MTDSPFKILYRQFVFRLVDVELLSANALGDAKKLLGQVAALLIAISLIFSLIGSAASRRGVVGWNAEHLLISTAMLVCSVIAVLSWESFFPDRRDILSLSPLPVEARTVVLAKIAALVSVVGMLTAAFSTLPFSVLLICAGSKSAGRFYSHVGCRIRLSTELLNHASKHRSGAATKASVPQTFGIPASCSLCIGDCVLLFGAADNNSRGSVRMDSVVLVFWFI